MFDDITDIYEAMIDWDKRLGNEEPFYRSLFERARRSECSGRGLRHGTARGNVPLMGIAS